MPDRDLRRPLTVVNRFTVKGDPEKFERAFREHSQYLRRQRDFDYLVTVRLADSPQTYVNLGHWRSLEGFIAAVHTETFVDHVRRLEPMVETEADQVVSVDRLLVRNALVGHENVLLLPCTLLDGHQPFQDAFRELTRYLTTVSGFGGADLLRSTVRPQTYLGLLWWYDTESCDRVLAREEFRERYGRLQLTARVALERTRHLAYERLIRG